MWTNDDICRPKPDLGLYGDDDEILTDYLIYKPIPFTAGRSLPQKGAFPKRYFLGEDHPHLFHHYLL